MKTMCAIFFVFLISGCRGTLVSPLNITVEHKPRVVYCFDVCQSFHAEGRHKGQQRFDDRVLTPGHWKKSGDHKATYVADKNLTPYEKAWERGLLHHHQSPRFGTQTHAVFGKWGTLGVVGVVNPESCNWRDNQD